MKNTTTKKTTPKRKAPARSRAKSKKTSKTSTFEKVTEVRTGYARLALMLVFLGFKKTVTTFCNGKPRDERSLCE